MQIQKISGITGVTSNPSKRENQTSFGTKWGIVPSPESWLGYLKLPGYVKKGIKSVIKYEGTNGITDAAQIGFKNGQWLLNIKLKYAASAPMPVDFKSAKDSDQVAALLNNGYKSARGAKEI